MTDHARLLKQIREDARPYIEQALDLAEVFTGFRKLASENGLDWGVIKALIKAEVQDEKEGGSVKVDRIIEKADFASAYADMLGLGSNMNEKNFSSESSGGAEAARRAHNPEVEGASPSPATNPATVSGPVGVSASPEECAVPIQQAGPHDGGSHVAAPELLRTFAKDADVVSADETAPVSGDAGEITKPGVFQDASPNNSVPASDGPANSEDGAVPAVPVSSSTISGDDPGPIPDFLDRRSAA